MPDSATAATVVEWKPCEHCNATMRHDNGVCVRYSEHPQPEPTPVLMEIITPTTHVTATKTSTVTKRRTPIPEPKDTEPEQEPAKPLLKPAAEHRVHIRVTPSQMVLAEDLQVGDCPISLEGNRRITRIDTHPRKKVITFYVDGNKRDIPYGSLVKVKRYPKTRRVV